MLNFENTEIAFANKNDFDLAKSKMLFSIMNSNFLVKWGSVVGLKALAWNLPIKSLIRKTIFEQFCGGENFDEVTEAAEKLEHYGMQTILDYGLEAKESEADFEHYVSEIKKAIDYAGNNNNIPVVSVKLTGLAPFSLLEQTSAQTNSNENIIAEFSKVIHRMDEICTTAQKNKVSIFIDAEESWIQKAIDDIADIMMERYNKTQILVYNTFQLYRTDRLEFLKKSHKKALAQGYILGAKLVRGAYMEKERQRAEELNYTSPIQVSKANTDKDFNLALEYCIQHLETISCVAATHNEDSCKLYAELIEKNGIDKKHLHCNFSQLYGMSDQISFNLSHSGYNVAKYVPYGPLEDVMPYLIRRAQENTSVAGQTSRELMLINKEIKRRKNNGR